MIWIPTPEGEALYQALADGGGERAALVGEIARQRGPGLTDSAGSALTLLVSPG